MANNAVRVKTVAGWIDLAYVAQGPQGPAGPVGPGVPAGGAAGQIMYKTGPNQSDTAWASAGGDLSGDYPNLAIRDKAVGTRELLLDSQQIDAIGALGNVAMPVSGTELGRNLAAGTDWRLSYTPAVNCWWEITYQFPQVHKNVAGWDYLYVNVTLGGTAILATATTEALAIGDGVARAMVSLYGPGGSQYNGMQATRRVPLVAGNTYFVRPVVLYTGAGWNITTGKEHMPTARGVAWAR